ncbi:MAG: hypothetical protein BA864_05090 [Desulfuromonadales bacterium C00003093]|nr:MAG: hypothetical protein BA864_05090 [Desulfuromonadales bacterium C00003093]
MNELCMRIEARTLKHVIELLKSVDDEGVFVIEPGRVSCRIVDGGNACWIHVAIPAGACDHFTAGEFRAGVDIGWLDRVLNVTPEMGGVKMRIDETEVHLEAGQHHASTVLVDAGMMKKVPDTIETKQTVAVSMSGRFFAQTIRYLQAVNADTVRIDAKRMEVAFIAVREDKGMSKYACKGDWLTRWAGDARSLYNVQYLSKIAEHVVDEVITLQFGVDTPVRIGWTHEGCEIEYILAHRVHTRP